MHLEASFDFLIKYGRKRIAIILAKQDDFGKARAQGLLGCEVLADTQCFDESCLIVTNYCRWDFYRIKNPVIQFDMSSIVLVDGVMPSEESIRQITGKIINMLIE